jgi:hypothetical protein
MALLPPPGPERQRQWRLLGVLVVLALVFVWTRWPSSGPTDPATQASNPLTASDLGDQGGLPEALRLASLGDDGPEPAVSRNLFRFGQPPAPPAPPPAPPPAYVPPPPAPVRETGPPPIPLELVGIWTPPGEARFASFVNTVTKMTSQGFEGGIIDGRYRLVKIQERSVIVEYLDGTGRRTIPIKP